MRSRITSRTGGFLRQKPQTGRPYSSVKPPMTVREFAYAVARIGPPRAHIKAVIRATAFEEFFPILFESRLIFRGNACAAFALYRRPQTTEISHCRTALSANRHFKVQYCLKFKYCYPSTIARWTLFVILRARFPALRNLG